MRILLETEGQMGKISGFPVYFKLGFMPLILNMLIRIFALSAAAIYLVDTGIAFVQ